MTEDPIVIIGAGPTGLGAAHRLHESGHAQWLLLESDHEVGGLAGSVTDAAGFTWDYGGHVVFSHYLSFSRLLNDILGPDRWLEHERTCYIRACERWIPYPFQNNLHRLPPEERAECIAGLVQAAVERRDAPYATFADFLVRTMGPGITRLFMRPYNSKVWGYDPSELAADWIAERVAVPDPVIAVRNLALGRDDCAWGPNQVFRFPRLGGTGAIWRALVALLPAERVRCGARVASLDAAAHRLTLASGETYRYSALISTMPLDLLADMVGGPLREPGARLVHSSTHVVGIGLRGRPAPEHAATCWMYFPEPICPSYRVTHFSHYSPYNVPDINHHWSLLCETTESPQRPIDANTIIDQTVAGLRAVGLIGTADIVCNTWHRRVERAYPTPTLQRNAVLGRLLPALRQDGILSRGRFGAWCYEIGNMDHSFAQGHEAADHLLHGGAEGTLAGALPADCY